MDKKVVVTGTEYVLTEEQVELIRKRIIVAPCYVPGNFGWDYFA